MAKVLIIANSDEMSANASLFSMLAIRYDLVYETKDIETLLSIEQTINLVSRVNPNHLFLGDISGRERILQPLKNMAKFGQFGLKSIASERPDWCEQADWLLGTEPGNILL